MSTLFVARNYRPWSVLRSFANYNHVTREVCRVDYHILRKMHPHKFIHLNEWEKQLKIRNTRHVKEERLRPYVNRISRDGKYIEVTRDEYEWILAAPLDDYIRNWTAQLVELGFNADRQICKAAYVVRMPSSRVLFFCLGMDFGLKTLYVTPQFKSRAAYRGAVYLSEEEAYEL